MIFSTPTFLFCFLPLLLGMYYLIPVKFRNLLLLITSLLFYFWGEQMYVMIMLLSIMVDFCHGLLVEHFLRKNEKGKARLMVASSVIMNLGILFFFKYWDFVAGLLKSAGFTWMPVLGIHLPIGISFFTFQTMSYTIDIYRGDAKAQHSIIDFGAFVTMFPQLIAGPIIRYKDLATQLNDRYRSSKEYRLDQFASGIVIFTIGLSKKLLIANNLGKLWEIYRDMAPAFRTVAGAWLGILAYSLQLYFDFSGYSDMAMGLGRMLSFEFPLNFNYPYMAASITDFWRRWHISLSNWFRDYVYIPLGGNRKGQARTYFNLLIVWAFTGLWHGASLNFFFWGLYYYVILVLEKAFLKKWLDKMPKVLGHIYALLLIMIGWTIFACEDISLLLSYLQTMFGFGRISFWNLETAYYFKSYFIVLLAGCLGSLPFTKKAFEALPEKTANILRPVLLILALLTCTAYMIAGSYNPFLYFRF